MHSWRWKHKTLSLLVLTCGLAIFCCSLALPPAHFSLNASSSLPQTLFLAIHFLPPFEKGQIVRIDHPTLKAAVGKIIIGKAGDRISINDLTLFVNDVKVGKIQTVSKSGKTYTPIKEGLIEADSYFVYTPHPDSFDSRYAEFGLIQEAWIAEVLWPIF